MTRPRALFTSLLTGVGFWLAVSAAVKPASAAEVDETEIAKALDGRWPVCEKESHLNRGAWVLDNPRVAAVSGDRVEIAGLASRLHCGKKNKDDMAWLPGRATGPETGTTVDGKDFSKWTEDLSFIVVGADARVLATIKAGNQDRVDLFTNLKIEEALSDADRESFTSGEKVRVQLTVFPRGTVYYQVHGQAATSLGEQNGGAYRISFAAQKTEEGLLVEP